ncbi:bifunctional diguanylate cyclase/phosphodiesterase [Rhodoferax sp. U11-2br]|uniref:putative bifunctional diguanylate cyclase/phosphodiesterase n=1 Tax=Rhodoferax sp. U11-2br TaxID=2838878 RepID=UPI001BE908A8|nr:EAL domain-containing protein [Rhodoferax sp. U11-2br]MBT3068674.1 EAL domain-containing protein [Rhodoferax sp. U11-2br]
MRAFTLTRYFSLLSFGLLLLAGVLLGTLVRQQELAQMERTAIERNISASYLLGNFLQQDIQRLTQISAGKTPQDLQALPELAELKTKLRVWLRGSDIVKVKIYSREGLTLFSTEAAQIGEDKSRHVRFLSARAGQVVSDLVHSDQFAGPEGMLLNVDLMSSYVPVQHNGQLVAVFEQYQDVTRLIQRIEHSLWRVGGLIAAVFVLLYVVLVTLVQRGQHSLTVQKALLEEANRVLDQRVAERTRELTASEAQLRESEARFRSLTEMSSDFYWESDAQHHFTKRTFSAREAADPVFCQTIFLGRLIWDVTTILPDAKAWQAHREMMHAHLPFRGFEVAHQGANTTLLYVSVSGDPVFDASGAFVGYRGVGRDITQRKQADTELRIAATAFESQQSTLVADVHGIVQRVNQALTESTGYSAQEIVGQPAAILRSERLSADFYAAQWASVEQTGKWQGEVWTTRKNGEVFPQWLSISSVKDEQGVVTHYIGNYIDISAQKQAEEEVKKLAFFDPLTGLPNRTLLRDRLQQTAAASARSGGCCAVLYLDLDNFKTLNDTQGHASGDQLLQWVAARLVDNLRQCDTVARIGGDEFVVVLPQLEARNQELVAIDVELVCQKLLQALARPYVFAHTDFYSTASMGVTFFDGQETSVDDVLKQADMAMYQAKSLGGNTFAFFDPVMESVALSHARLEVDLRQAIQSGQLELYYQPQVSGSSGRIVGAEALLRWQHPQRGLVPPGDFVPHAERTGLILPLGQWVLEQACVQLAAWAHQPEMKDLVLAVNVSAQQFKAIDFAEQVLATLARTGAQARLLKLELTESIFAGNIDEIVGMMNQLKGQGVGFSLDDFGTGYSSLAYLSRLPLDQLKIDRSFVANIESDNNNVAICAATIGLAHSLKLKVVAEGVENEAQRYFLSTVHRCDLLQGYLFGRPLPIGGFEDLLRSWPSA